MVRATGEFRAEMHTAILRVREKVAALVLDYHPPHFDSSAIGRPSNCACVVCGCMLKVFMSAYVCVSQVFALARLRDIERAEAFSCARECARACSKSLL